MKSATIQELFQTCPKCGGNLLIKFQAEDHFDYKCDDCGYTETRKRELKEIQEKSSKPKKEKKKKK